MVLLLFFLLLPLGQAAAAPVSASIPLDSWIYPAIDKLAGLGLIDSALQGSRPFSRHEAARLTREALDQAEVTAPAPVALEILRRLEGELQTSLREVAGSSAPGYIQPLREIRLDYLHQEGVPSVIASRPPGGTLDLIDARQFALDPNNFGLDYDEGHNGRVILETEARLGSFLLFNWRPLLLVGEEGDTSLRTLHGTATLGLGRWQVSAGRESLWWGQGRRGSLILTSNAAPLEMLRITNPTPVLLPWIFRPLGPFRLDLFWSRLESDRLIPEPYLAGLRMNIKPRPWLELGASRTVMFGGEGRPDVGFSDFFTILGGKNLEGGEDTSNQLAALDARLKIPPLAGAELYGEWGGEDEAGGFISHKSWIAGLYLPQLEPTGRLALRLEYADLTHESGVAPAWYRHGIYRSGYTYKGKVLGHHIGGAARNLYTELEARLSGSWTVRGSFDYQERGTDQLVEETHRQPAVEVEWEVRPGLTISAAYALDRVKNFGFTAGDSRDFHLLRAGVAAHW
ncbi:MAG: capsule assembly Wzi family protein [Desulfuromonadales bacterium]|nr:capsule assembly Wzi family protein [Desulfuromonadales bacterium]